MQPEPRFKKRVPCDLVVAGARHPGIVLNISRGGLYVQTSVGVQRGDWVAVDLNSRIERDAIGLDAVVMWNRKVAAQLRGVRHGGIGLQIRNAGRDYYNLLQAVAGETGTTYRGSADGRDPAATLDPSQPRYRVRVGLRDHPRSKTLVVAADDEAQARSAALARAGDDTWDILEVHPIRGDDAH